MKENLQSFSHQDSDYQRPNLNRVVVPNAIIDAPGSGATEKNSARLPGPDSIAPVAMTVPSLRARRGSFTIAMTAMTVGFLLIAFNSPWSNDFLAPGPLSSPHAQLLAGQGGERCAACHAAAEKGFAGWVTGHHGSTAQSDLCMKCHDNTIDAAFAMHPHGISEQALARTNPRPSTKSLTGQLVSTMSLSHSHGVACSVCHQEHHGNVSLSQLTDRQCQSCHSQTFSSFETGHPEFNQWPQFERQNIAFDHQTHLKLHFKNAKTEFNCNLCHVDDGSQKVKRMASFEQSCAACHSQQIADSGQSGWTLFELPRLDMAAIEALKLDVGNWPASATSDFDGELPPMMRLLLAGDLNMQNTISELSHDFSFGDIDMDDRDSVELAVELVWGIKRLLRDLAHDGRAAMDRRLRIVMGDRFSQDLSKQLLGGLNPEVFKATAKRWLPDLETELLRRRTQTLSSGRRKPPMRLTAFSKPTSPSQDLLAKNPLSEETFDSAEELRRPNADSSGPPPSDNRSAADPSGSDSSTFGVPAANSNASQLLVPNPLTNSAQASAELENRSPQGAPPNAVIKNTPVSPQPNAAPPGDRELMLLPEIAGVAMKSGWYRNDRLLKIGYRPHGHADPVVKSWSDCVSRVVNADTNPATSALLAVVCSPTSSGNCRHCHTVSRTDEGVFEFAWLADRRDDQRSAFTKFSHRPHLTQGSISECANCHRIDESVSLVGAFDGCDRSIGISNFHPIVKSDCVSCHQKGRTESGCMQCHNYHVGRPENRRP